ncbi:MAG TPA: Gfo/Idh/MocA family oxidoreductase [Candidatus Latescibacteria bacterium]|nr:Gfo/Idh/MocA family oxidoreductase [Candidatus Latescibacterota bacterium]
MYSGGISESHYRGFTDTGRARIELVWDIDPERAGEAAARWGAKVASGKHVLCEKPIALNMEDAIAMRDTALHSGIKFMIGFNLRYNPSLATLKEVQMEGWIGGAVSAWTRQHAPTSSARWRRIQETGFCGCWEGHGRSTVRPSM